MAEREPVVSVHALDASGEEGLLTDAGVLRELGCRAAVAATCILLPRPGGRAEVEVLPEAAVSRQIESVLSRGRPNAVRIGTVADPGQAVLLARLLDPAAIGPIVLAPTLRWSGADLMDPATREAIEREIVPRCRLLLMRVRDLRDWTGLEFEGLEGLREAAEEIRRRGARAVLLSGVVARGRVLDYLDDGGDTAWLDAPRIQAPWLEGVADAHAAAVTAFLAQGQGLAEAARASQRYVGHRLSRVR